MHYQRWKTHGDPEFRLIGGRSCSVEGCLEKHYGKGLCGVHWRRETAEAKRQYDAARHEARDNDPVAREAKRQQDREYYLANRERHAEYSRKYRKENAEQLAESWRKWYAANAEQRRANARAYALANPEKVRATKLAYYQTHRQDFITRAAKRRALEVAQSTVPFTSEQWKQRVAYYGGKCWMCRIRPYEEMEHVKPLSKGGAHILANLRPACFPCNRSKGAKWPYPVELRDSA
jgi:5-methylcytosine-specific restriction endonuclease McrA